MIFATDEPAVKAASPARLKALMALRAVSVSQPNSVPIWDARLPLALASRIWQRRSRVGPCTATNLHLLPVAPAFWQGVPAVRAGLAAGRLAPGRFEPDHALALAGSDTTDAATLAVTAAAAGAYLRGETLPATGADG